MDNQLFDNEALKMLLRGRQVALAYLFGSHARANAGPLSDIDIAFLFEQSVPPAKHFELGLQLSRALRMFFQTDKVDLLNLDETNDPLLRYQAVLYGKLLHAADMKQRFALEATIMQAYEDTRYLRAVQTHYLTEHIRQGRFGQGALFKNGGRGHVAG